MLRKIGIAVVVVLVAGGSLFWYTKGPTAEHSGEHPGESVKTHEEKSHEHPGEEAHEQSGQEHHGSQASDTKKKQKTFTATDIKEAITGYINKDQDLKNGYFYIYDKKLDRDWKLTFSKLHPVRKIQRDGKTIYFACTNFKVVGDETHSVVDLDFWMEAKGHHLEPYKIKIHKVDGEARFTYQDDRPVKTN
ncbi:MAG: hypothetical protein ABEJ65_02970 [bacterium]